MDQLVGQFIAKLLPIVLLLGALSILGTLFRFLALPAIKGYVGEALINFWSRRLLDQKVYHLIPNVSLPTSDGTTQIDHVIVSRYGIFVLETKTYKGWIFGSERDAEWTQVVFRQKNRFQNPLRQNYRHTKTLSDLTGIPHGYFISMVVFIGSCEFKTEMPDAVMQIGYFIRFIKNHQKPVIQDEQVPEVVAAIREWAGTVSEEQRRAHVANLKARFEAEQSTSEPADEFEEPDLPSCPRCGARMVERTRRQDGGKFWGCSTYPACRGARNMD